MNILKHDSKIEVLLVQPEYGDEVRERIFQPGLEFPYNLTCLSGYLEREGISNEIFDWRIHENPDVEFIETLKRLKPRIVGITSVTSGIKNAQKIAGIVKNHNVKAMTVIGGCHASALPEETLLSCPDFDLLVHGEGEVALTSLITGTYYEKKNLEELKGIAFRKDGRVIMNEREAVIMNLDTLPLPARHKIDISKYAPNPATRNYMRLPSTGLSVGRGCPYNCLFCYKGVWGKSIRFRSHEHVLQEIKECIDTYGIHDFRFYDDVLTVPKWDVKGFCRKILHRNFDISWSCWSRVNDVDYETLSLMKKAGCYHIKYGIEFGTEKAIKLSRKGITLEQSRAAVRTAKEVGIECKGSFIFGIPGETLEDCKATIQFALDISPDFATFYGYDSIPGSKFYQQAKEGLIKDETLPQEVTRQLVSEAYRRFYIRPAFVFQRFKNIFRNPSRETKAVSIGIKMMLSFFLKKIFR